MNDILCNIIHNIPDAIAYIEGSACFSDLSGCTRFYQIQDRVMVVTEVYGLPLYDDMNKGKCANHVFGYHIHQGKSCSGNCKDPFANALNHYNPDNCFHPYHQGDLPPLFGNDGHAFSAVLLNRFMVKDVIGKTIIIHSMPDDFYTQPSGNAGEKIACGVIQRYR